MPKKKKTTKMKTHHKIHLSYIIAIIIILSIASASLYLIYNSKKSFVVQQVYYKEIGGTTEDPVNANIRLNPEQNFLDEDCNLGENFICEDFKIEEKIIHIWASHRYDDTLNVTIKSPTCAKEAIATNMEMYAGHYFTIEHCINNIADEKGILEIPILISLEGNIEKTQIGKISTTIN